MLIRRTLFYCMFLSFLFSLCSASLEGTAEAQSFSVTVASSSYWIDANGHFNSSKATETFPAEMPVVDSRPYNQNAVITTLVGFILVDGQEQHIEMTIYQETGTKTKGFWTASMLIRDNIISVTGPLKNLSLLKGIGIESDISSLGSGTCKIAIKTPF